MTNVKACCQLIQGGLRAMQCAIRKIHGLIFECPSPSIWNLVGAPITLAYNGRMWVLSMVDREGHYREGLYGSRDKAIQFMSACYGVKVS